MFSLGYICTNYNNSNFTVSAVTTLFEANSSNVQCYCVVVDNSSDGENLDILYSLERRYSNVTVIYNDNNVGYFNGLNIGIKHIREVHPKLDHIIIGNNDLLFPVDFIENIFNNLRVLDKYPVVSPNVRTLDGVYQNPHVIKSISRTRELMYDLYYSNYYLGQLINWAANLTKKYTGRTDEQQHDVAQEIWQGHGSCYILGPTFFRNFDELWAPTFLMGEEFFLSVQLKEKGMKVYYEPNIKVTHCCHASISKMPRKLMWEYARKAHRLYREYVHVWK